MREHAGYLARKAYPVAQPCEVCGDADGQRCHFDYAEPLWIRWLCAVHHVEWDCGRKWAEAAKSRPRRPDLPPLLVALAEDDGTLIQLVAIERDEAAAC